ncbi:ankyrin containing protein (ISS) [Seminavis robusta]|uniref:Ankyrin containing protein (ISS) n=1 Tax=Seminavis robusta TaxID=568900 RepID=A0A9N8EFV5_9STRA|nr:ankyrin containing protein (ISS) [Seminavis robusta]|eukprot:Sro883_g215430.1 ankyrin containing protein (ISS) (148) ;mRNA; f:4897-5340
MLKFAHEKLSHGHGYCLYAATNGHLECLKYARKMGCPWDEWICCAAAGEAIWMFYDGPLNRDVRPLEGQHINAKNVAAGEGQLESLKYILRQEKDNFLHETLFETAATNHRWVVLKWLCLEAGKCAKLALLEKGLELWEEYHSALNA